MISASVIQCKREQEVTMSLWNNWLYRRLLFLMAPANWSLGILDFCAGRDNPRKLGGGAISCYIIFGKGQHEHGTKSTAFGPGTILSLTPNEYNTFTCDKPTRLLVVASETPLDFDLNVQRLSPGNTITGTAHVNYVLSGSVEVSVGSNSQKLGATTAFSIAQQIEYNLTNSGNQDALIVGIGVRAAAKREADGAALAQK